MDVSHLAENAHVGDLEPTRARSPLRRPTGRTTQLGPRSTSGRVCPLAAQGRSESDVRQANRQLHNSAPPESTENKCPTPIAKPNPFRRHAILASGRQCLPALSRSALRPTARRCIEHRIPCPTIRLTALRFEFCSPNSQSAGRTSRKRPRSEERRVGKECRS